MALILSGRETSAKITEELKSQVAELKSKGVKPTLAIVLTGEDQYSVRYVNLKAKRAEEIGVTAQVHHLKQTSTREVVELVKRLNEDRSIHGVLVQLPCSPGLSEIEIVEAISPSKDVDGLTPSTLGKIMMGEKCLLPAGVAAIIELLHRYNIKPEGKHWVIAGPTNFLGKPLIGHLTNLKARVSFCKKDEPNIADLVRQADVLSTELFMKHAIKSNMLKPGAVVIDNGNNYEGSKVYGDVETEAAMQIVSAITPVPGGVGPMLITMLIKNTIEAALNS